LPIEEIAATNRASCGWNGGLIVRKGTPLVRKFKAPDKTIGNLPAESAAELITAIADVALVIDRKGIVRDFAIGNEDLALDIGAKWSGQSWAHTVTDESKPKIDALLADVAAREHSRGRQVNHPSARGGDVPILYHAVRAGRDGHVLALGRDLRNVAALQQRLIDAEQSMEREYARLRNAETRYRMLFQLALEPVLIIDASSLRVSEANPAAAQVLDEPVRRLIGKPLLDRFDDAGAQAVAEMLTVAQSKGHGGPVRVRVSASGKEFSVHASHVRQEGAGHCLLRMQPVGKDAALAAVLPGPKASVAELVERLPDGFVVTGTDGRIVTANRAFVDLAQLASEEQARGEQLERWLGRPGVDFGVLVANLRQHGSVRAFATSLRGEFGSTTEVEISAVAVTSGDQPCFGFAFRNVSRRSVLDVRSMGALPRSAEDLKDLVGRVAIKDLVRQATDVIERLCIEAALEITGDNRASAAEMLGMSRQSFYVKLRRYGLGDLDSTSG
jgi:transcriptional regulator PpsR